MDDDRFQDDLRRFWDEIARGGPAAPGHLDPELAATIRSLHAMRDVPPPNPAYAKRLREDIIGASAVAHPVGSAVGAWPNGRKAPVSLRSERAPFPISGQGGRWALAQLATAALLVLTLVASLVSLGPGRFFARQGEYPSLIPAISATPATPAASQTPVAELIWQLGGGPGLPFDNPTALALDPAGNLWVPDAGNDRFQIFTPDGEFVESWGTAGSGDGQFNFQLGGYGYAAVVWDVDGNMYVADAGNYRIQKFSPDRGFITTWASRGTEDGQFIGLNSLAIDGNGRVFAADHDRDDVQVFNTDGRLLEIWGGGGAEVGEFANPGGVTVDAAGNVYVAEYLNHRVQKFSPDGESLAVWGEFGRENGQHNYPTAVAVDEQRRVFVVEWGDHRIQVLDADGQFLASWGELGYGEGQFANPLFATLDGEGNIYVSNESSDVVQKFRLAVP